MRVLHIHDWSYLRPIASQNTHSDISLAWRDLQKKIYIYLSMCPCWTGPFRHLEATCKHGSWMILSSIMLCSYSAHVRRYWDLYRWTVRWKTDVPGWPCRTLGYVSIVSFSHLVLWSTTSFLTKYSSNLVSRRRRKLRLYTLLCNPTNRVVLPEGFDSRNFWYTL